MSCESTASLQGMSGSHVGSSAGGSDVSGSREVETRLPPHLTLFKVIPLPPCAAPLYFLKLDDYAEEILRRMSQFGYPDKTGWWLEEED